MTDQPDPGAPALFRAVGLQPDGPAVLGRPIRAGGPGVYVVELPAALPAAPIDINRVGKWIETVPTLRLDGARPTAKALAARLGGFWLPSRRVLFIGAAETSVAGRLAALERHVLGERRPHAASQWLKTLRVDALRVWWATTPATEEYEDALLGAFAASVPPAEVAALPDSSVVLPWANLRTPAGQSRRHGITGAVPPAEVTPPAPPARVVELPPGDAEGARVEDRNTGTKRRTGAVPAASSSAPPRARAPRAAATGGARAGAGGSATARPSATARAAAAGPRPADPVLVSADGLARLETEHAALVARRPEIVARIRAAKELGDLKENSDYTAAREEQSFLEGRIQAIEAQLRAAVVVDAPEAGGRVTVGSTVTVEIDGERRRLTIVGTTEANPSAGRISHASPIGRALVGAAAGDEVTAATPGGAVPVLVVEVD